MLDFTRGRICDSQGHGVIRGRREGGIVVTAT